MTSTTQRPQRHTDEEFDREHRKSNGLVITVVILAILLVGLGGWVIYDASISDTTDGAIDAGGTAVTAVVPAEVDAAIDTYIAAWENPNGDAFLEAVTDDFIINEYIYFEYADGVRLQDIQSYDDREYVAQAAFDPFFPWIVERGEMVSFVGEGPWYVSFPETWQVDSNVMDGMATYMLIDVDGAVKVKNHYWVGVSEMIDF